MRIRSFSWIKNASLSSVQTINHFQDTTSKLRVTAHPSLLQLTSSPKTHPQRNRHQQRAPAPHRHGNRLNKDKRAPSARNTQPTRLVGVFFYTGYWWTLEYSTSHMKGSCGLSYKSISVRSRQTTPPSNTKPEEGQNIEALVCALMFLTFVSCFQLKETQHIVFKTVSTVSSSTPNEPGRKIHLTAALFTHKIFIRFIWTLYINDYKHLASVKSLSTVNSEQEVNLTNKCVKRRMNSLQGTDTLAASR